MTQQGNQPNQLTPFQQFQQIVQQQFNAVSMQLIRTRQTADAAVAELAFMRAGRTPRVPVEFTSQYGEDVLAWALFGKQQFEGFFLEVGAFDGYRYSVTYGFEALGWNGLLIEPLPAVAERCRQRRPGSRVVQAAVSRPGAPSPATFHVLEDHYGGMLSYLTPTDTHVKETSWAKRSETTVPVTTIDDLLADHRGVVDLAVIDVEGNELDVLRGFDLDRFKPRILIVEDNSFGADGTHAAYLSKFPYELAGRCSVSAIYIRKDDPEMSERLKWLQLS